MNKRIIILAAVTMTIICRAEWEAWTPAMLVEKTDLIGVGILGDVRRSESNNVVRCEGTLRFSELLKGTNTAVILKWGFSIPPEEDAMDHTSLASKPLLWFLNRTTNGSFSVLHMDGIQNTNRTDEFKKAISTGDLTSPMENHDVGIRNWTDKHSGTVIAGMFMAYRADGLVVIWGKNTGAQIAFDENRLSTNDLEYLRKYHPKNKKMKLW